MRWRTPLLRRLASVLEGRKDRDGFGSSTGRKKQKQGGTSNKEKNKMKNIPIAARLQAVRRPPPAPRSCPSLTPRWLVEPTALARACLARLSTVRCQPHRSSLFESLAYSWPCVLLSARPPPVPSAAQQIRRRAKMNHSKGSKNFRGRKAYHT